MIAKGSSGNGCGFVMIGAMYENGGNTTQRFLDGHPELYVYPFESQPGTRFVTDRYSSLFPVKYRWPVFPLDGTPADDYESIIDEEYKVRTRTPRVSKFRDEPFAVEDAERKRLFVELMRGRPRTTGGIIEAYFQASFDAWKGFSASGRNRVYVGYSPVITLDAERIIRDIPGAQFLHVVRNPFSGYADTKKRPVPLSLRDYGAAWVTNQYHALMCRRLYPDQFTIVRYEDLIIDGKAALGQFCGKAGISAEEDSLSIPTWNGKALKEVYPWGTIRVPTPEVNLGTARELSPEELRELHARTSVCLKELSYEEFLESV